MMRRTLFVLLMLLPTPLWAQGTVIPPARSCWSALSGAPLSGGTITVHAAGTSTLSTLYATAALSGASLVTNPAELDSLGCVTIFLAPSSYKVTLKNSAGVQQWSVDNVAALAPFSVDQEVSGTAGELLAAGEVVYLNPSDGRWWKTDSDAAGTSITANIIGIAKAAIASGVEGSIRLQGRVTGLTGLTLGASYFISGTPGAMTSTAPTNRRFLGIADSTTSLILTPQTLHASTPTLNTLVVNSTSTFTGLISAGGGIQFTTGVPTPPSGSWVKASNTGLTGVLVAGNTEDFALLSPAPTYATVMRVPTGTVNTVFAGTLTGTGIISAGSGMAVANVGANSCGTTAATIAGNNNAGNVTVGATGGTQCRITFTFAAANRWSCTASNESAAALVRGVYVDTTHADLVGTFGAGDVLSYVCLPR